MPLIAEVLLGGAVGALIQAIFIAKEKATFFKKTLEHLESTLQLVGPIMEEVIKSEQVQSDVCTRFVQQLEKVKILVEMYYDIKMWKFLKRRKVKKLIQQMDASLQRLLARDFQVEQLVYLTVIDRDVAEMNTKMDRVIALLEGTKANGFESPEPDKEGILSSPENDSNSDKLSSPSVDKPPSPAFELRWKMNKDRCLEFRIWRSNSQD